MSGAKLKGKTYDEIHGIEGAKLKKQKISKKLKGIKRSEEFKRKIRDVNLGIKKGIKLSKEHKEKISNKLKGSKRGPCSKETRIKIGLGNKGKNLKIKNINQVIDVLKNVFKYENNISKGKFFSNVFVKERLGGHETIRVSLKKEDLNLDDIALQVGVQFKQRISKVGTNEKQMLDDIEKGRGIIIERDFVIGKYKPDGFDRDNYIIHEIDEVYHKYKQPKDKFRENEIKRMMPGVVIERHIDGWTK